MTREQKLALIVGFALVLIVGVLVSDHFSLAQHRIDAGEAGLAEALEPETPGFGRDVTALAIAPPTRAEAPAIDETYAFGPETRSDAGRRTLEDRARSALDTLAEGIDQAGELLRESQNGNLPAAQIDEFVTPSIRDADREPERASAAPVEREAEIERPSRPARAEARRYPVHVVSEGESLWTIAERYYSDGALWTKLAEFNADRTGPNHAVYAGASIIVPPLEVLEPGAARGQVKTTPRRGSDDAGAREKAARRYTVESGDTLSEISQKLLGTSKRWREIMELNGMTDPAALRVGMTLKIPSE